jgi:tetratricopeptide (TPR) repeat protein
LNFFRAIRENGDEFVILTEDEQRIIKNRINYKRGSIYKLAEQGRFTPDWLAYREAQRKHLTEESLLEAIWMYLDVIKNYPNTLSAESSECYVIKILTLFSNPAFVKEASKRYEIILEELEDAKAHLRQAKRTAMAQPFMVGLETYVDRLKFVVKMWESTPFGRKALQQAEERAEKFLEKNKYGLYRGEVLLDIGTAHLVSFFDVDNGEKWLTRAAEWFDNVQKFDKDLKDFELPESVRKVSQPPKEERYKDRWTNIKLSQPKAGQFFNRRSCSWYWNSKRKDVTLLQGLVAFAKEDYETAEKHWNLLAELDKEFYSQQKVSGSENATTLARLTWNLKNQPGSLYATPLEMTAFIDIKQRTAVLLADLCMEMQDYRLAEKRFRGLLLDIGIKNNRNQSAYCTFALATALVMQHKSKEAIKLFEMFSPNRPFDKTPSAPRAILNYANYQTQFINHPDRFINGNRAYEYLIKTYPNTKQADTALYYRARNCAVTGDISTAIKMLKLYLQTYPNANYKDYALKYITYFERLQK